PVRSAASAHARTWTYTLSGPAPATLTAASEPGLSSSTRNILTGYCDKPPPDSPAAGRVCGQRRYLTGPRQRVQSPVGDEAHLTQPPARLMASTGSLIRWRLRCAFHAGYQHPVRPASRARRAAGA